jgi:hypothetical protein
MLRKQKDLLIETGVSGFPVTETQAGSLGDNFMCHLKMLLLSIEDHSLIQAMNLL